MPDTIQNQIMDDMDAVLETLKTAGTLAQVAHGTYELYKVDRPAASVIPDEEITENMIHDSDDAYQEKLRVAIRIVVEEGVASARKTLGEIIGDIETAMEADVTRSGLAADTVKVGTKWLFLDEHYPRAGADLNYLITYATQRKDPRISAFNL